MADLNVIKFNREGDPSQGLQDWGPISADIIASGNPTQIGHTYLDNDSGVFTSGVWHCTPFEQIETPYDVDEFMMVLDGSIIAVDESGNEQRFRAGEAFYIPKGTPMTWKQDEPVLKYYAIYDNAKIPLQANSELRATLINPRADLPAITQHDPAMYESEVPDMGWLTLYKDPSAKFQVGVWDCSPMKRVATTIERSELMHIIEGSGSITNADGVVFEFSAGDTFMVPVGMGYQWENHSYVRKIFCSYTP